MTDRLKAFFEQELVPGEDADEYERAVGIQYATAALLIEVSKADSDEDEVERAVIRVMLQDTFDLDDETLDKIVELADDGSESRDVNQFTNMINEFYGEADKKKLVEYLWVVAFADGRLDKYEEQFIAKVAGLLGLSDGDLNQARSDAQNASFI